MLDLPIVNTHKMLDFIRQFNYELGHANFLTIRSSQYFQNIYRRKKIVIDGNSRNKITKLRHVPCFCDRFLLVFHSNEIIQPFIIIIEGHIPPT